MQELQGGKTSTLKLLKITGQSISYSHTCIYFYYFIKNPNSRLKTGTKISLVIDQIFLLLTLFFGFQEVP